MLKITPFLLLLAFPLFCDISLAVEVDGNYEVLFRSLNALVSEPQYVQDLARKIGRPLAGRKLAVSLQSNPFKVDITEGTSLCGICKVRKPWWRHQMETFSALLALCAGNSPVPMNSPHKGQWRGALMFSLICVWINTWVNNGKAGDLRRYRVYYDVTVMTGDTAGYRYDKPSCHRWRQSWHGDESQFSVELGSII